MPQVPSPGSSPRFTFSTNPLRIPLKRYRTFILNTFAHFQTIHKEKLQPFNYSKSSYCFGLILLEFWNYMATIRQTNAKRRAAKQASQATDRPKTDKVRLGFIGMAKLGLPCALAMDMHGHDVMGYDVDASRMQKRTINYRETAPDGVSPLEPLLRESNLKFGLIEDVVKHSEIIFVAIQTPHEERYEGITRVPDERIDFNYDHLAKGIAQLSRAIEENGEDRIVVIISTVLPGTLKSRIFPVINRHVKLCYNPFFIAMGTTMRDFLNPEFVLFGVVDNAAAAKVEKFYKTLHNGTFYRTTLENAELIKVAYNTFIGMKIVYANVMMEICHKIGGTMDVDAITGAMKLATNRLISPKYLSAGMGDGGGCHPRDNIAMSWLSRQLDLSYDFFEAP